MKISHLSKCKILEISLEVSTTGLNPNGLGWTGGPDACRNSKADCPQNQVCQYKTTDEGEDLNWGEKCDKCPGTTWRDCQDWGYESERYWTDCMDICASGTISLTRVIHDFHGLRVIGKIVKLKSFKLERTFERSFKTIFPTSFGTQKPNTFLYQRKG